MTGTKDKPVIKVADFGLAKAYEISGQYGFTRTKGGTMGTPYFMSRQQIKDFKYSKQDVDVWAAAATYYFMLTGDVPKEFTGKKDIWVEAFTQDAVPVLKRNSRIPKKLAEVIDAALMDRIETGIGVKTAVELKKMIEKAL